MTPEEVDALLRRAGIRPAWEGTREARPGYQQQQSPAGALADPRTVPYRRVPTRRDREFSRASLADTTQRGAWSEPRNQFAEAGMSALEMTGAPSFARGVRSIQANQPGEAAGHFAMGGLGLLGTASLPFGSGARGSYTPWTPPRIPRIQQAMPEAQGIPNAPPRLPGRATDGSVLPIRPREPIRNSLRGGSDDLNEAARQSRGETRLRNVIAEDAERDARMQRATISEGALGNDPITFYQFDTPALTNVRFRPKGAGAFNVEFSARGLQRGSVGRSEIESSFGDALAALESHAAQNPGARYVFEAEQAAQGHLYRQLGRYAQGRANLVETGPDQFELTINARTAAPDGGSIEAGRAPDAPNAGPPRPPMFPGGRNR